MDFHEGIMESHESSASPLLSPEFKVTAEEAAAVLRRLAQRRHERRHIRIVLVPLFIALLSALIGGLYLGERHPQLHTPGLRKRAECESNIDPAEKEAQSQGPRVEVKTILSTEAATTSAEVTSSMDGGSISVYMSEFLTEVVYTSIITPSPLPAPVDPQEPAEQPKEETPKEPEQPAPAPTTTQPPIITVGALFERTPCGDGVDCCGDVRCTAAFSTGGFWPDKCTKPAEDQTSCLYACTDPGFTITDGLSCAPTSTTSSSTSSSTSTSASDNVGEAAALATPTGSVTCEADETCEAITGLTANSEKCSEGKCGYVCAAGACTAKEGEVLGACIPTGEPISANCVNCNVGSTYNAQAAQCSATAPARYRRW